MKTLFILACLVGSAIAQVGYGANVGIGANVGLGVAGAQADSSYNSITAGTQYHVAANHWGNSTQTHLLIDTVTIPVAIQVTRASWNTGNAYTTSLSRTNIYDVGLHCISGACEAGKLYTHTGPLLSSETNPSGNVQISVALVADQNTVCQSYPCTLPAGMYSLTTGSGELPQDTMSLWSDSTNKGEYHIANSPGNPVNPFVSGYVQSGITNTPSGGNTSVTLPVTMTNGQAVNAASGGFSSGMQVRVAGLTPSGCTAGPNNIRTGIGGTFTLTGATSTTITLTVSGTVTCAVDTAAGTAGTCGGVLGTVGAGGLACVGAGLPQALTQLLVDSGYGYYCYADGSECSRSDFAGPAGTQTASHSVGMIFY